MIWVCDIQLGVIKSTLQGKNIRNSEAEAVVRVAC